MSFSILKVFSKNSNKNTTNTSKNPPSRQDTSMEDRKIQKSVRGVQQRKSGRIKPTSGRTSITDKDPFNGQQILRDPDARNGYNTTEDRADSNGKGHNRHRSSTEELNGHDVADDIMRIAEKASRNM